MQIRRGLTSQSALSSSLQSFAGLAESDISEYPMEPKLLCQELTTNRIELDKNGMISAPDKPGTGMDINLDAVKKYLVQTQIQVGGKTLYTTPSV